MISVLKTRGTPDGHVRARQRASEADNLAWRPLPPQYVRQHSVLTLSLPTTDRIMHRPQQWQ